MSIPHVIAFPYAAQGHVIPMMELVQKLAQHGIKVTFVNTDFNHNRVINTLPNINGLGERIHLVSIPDGLKPGDDRNNLGMLSESIDRVMPSKLQELIEKINEDDDDKITCLIVDVTVGWGIEIAEKMGIRGVAFCPAAAAMLGLIASTSKLIQDGIINNDGTVPKKQIVHLSPSMPAMSTENFPWNCFHDDGTTKKIFEIMIHCDMYLKMADRIICNSAYELEPAAFSLFPKVSPIGPLLANNKFGKKAGYFWPEDLDCLTWLDQQPASSVIYVAFGSFTIFDQTQFQELALGLELTNKPFLWVVRPDMTDGTNVAYPEGFEARIGTRGRMVGWAPQEKVLSHPSVACFLSHCGWNSTIEGVSNGLPILCWPYFADQFFNQSYICDVWNIGLGFDKDENGIIRKGEIKDKVSQLLEDKTFKERAIDLKEMVLSSVEKDGCSYKNFNDVIKWMKD